MAQDPYELVFCSYWKYVGPHGNQLGGYVLASVPSSTEHTNTKHVQTLDVGVCVLALSSDVGTCIESAVDPPVVSHVVLHLTVV